MAYLLRNTETGWTGSVTEKMYARLIAKAEYEDAGGETTEPGDTTAGASPQGFSEAEPGDYRIESRGAGWYDVFGPGGAKVNESALREDDARALADEKNA